MYYVSPFTYLVDGMLSTGLANTKIECSSIEWRFLDPPNDKTCGEYLTNFRGFIENPGDRAQCKICPESDTNSYLAMLNSDYSHRWRNFGIMWGFISFNVCAALFLYWLARVPKKQKVLDSPPTEQASRVPTKVSKPEVNSKREVNGAAREMQSEKEGGVGQMNGLDEK